MVQGNGSGGLCLTCNNAPECFHRARRGPALFCELFDDYVPLDVSAASGQRRVSATPPPSADRAEAEAVKYTGLCMNCAHRETCGEPRTTGGVWHCENYE